tara:strand:- start:23965 stop:25302 length:1338 start_codon:yes stop_codon:yes gene_type:complete
MNLMRTCSFVAGCLLILTPGTFLRAEAPPNFVSIFNGRDLDGWEARPHFSPIKLAEMSEDERAEKKAEWMADARQHWSVENGELVNDGHGAYLVTEKDYRDYELLIEYKTVPRADSGIYLKGNPQVQIWDYTDPKKYPRGADLGSGSLWNNTAGAPGKDPFVLADKPFGQWNQFRIQQVGARTSVWLNDHMVVDHAIMENYWDRESPLFVSGPIELQTHGGEIRWRNIYIRELSSDEANAVLREHKSQAFAPIFDGKSLDHWHGAVENYEVVDGSIRCKEGQGGMLLAEKEYGNFIARVEFRLPPGGNNGLVIRSPGTGNAAYDSMTELQVLDNDHEKYATLDPRQYHGSSYGMVPAKRGFLRETGEWNFQEVTVDGSTIKVELNGNVILDADLSQVTEFAKDREHPGKDRTSGFFGFAGHRDPVEFRNISIRELAPTIEPKKKK